MTVSLSDKIRILRETNDWTQEEMAEKMSMSKNGYAKLERGESKLNIERLEQIANIFRIEISDLLALNEKGLICLINENSQNSNNYYGNDERIIFENEKLRLILQHKDEIIAQKDSEIAALKDTITILKNNQT